MISRRDIFRMTASLTSAGWLRAQNTERPASSIKPEKVVVSVSVNDAEGRYISDLKSSDFRVFEDDILQKVETLTTKPLVSQLAHKGDSFYIITYYPNPSNHNEGYRIIKVEIVPDVGERWTVRHRPGYRPRQ